MPLAASEYWEILHKSAVGRDQSIPYHGTMATNLHQYSVRYDQMPDG